MACPSMWALLPICRKTLCTNLVTNSHVIHKKSTQTTNTRKVQINFTRSFHSQIPLCKQSRAAKGTKKKKQKGDNIKEIEEADLDQVVPEVEKKGEGKIDPFANHVNERLEKMKKVQEAFEKSESNIAKVFRSGGLDNSIQQFLDKLRNEYPEAAKIIDEKMSNQTIEDMFVTLKQEFPELSDPLSDTEVFEFLYKFLAKEDINPILENIRENLPKLEEQEKQEREREHKLNTATVKILGPVIPEVFEIPQLKDEEPPDLKLQDVIPRGTLEVERLMYEKISKLDTRNLLDRKQFFEGVDMKDPEAVAQAERQYIKYNEIIEQSKKSEIEKSLPPETEPIIEASVDVHTIFRPASVGKYIRFSVRDQRKYLPEGWCGKLEEREFKNTKETSLILREITMDVIKKLNIAKNQFFSKEAIKPILLYGDRGVGKSAVIQQIVYWARKSDWLVINIKSGLKWVHSGDIIQKSNLFTGCWDQPYLGVRFLSTLIDAHHDKLKKLPIRTKFTLGKFNGKTLYDLVEYGAALHEYACEVTYHLRNELQRVIEYPVLITIDDYNALYNYNQAFRDPECKHFKPRKLRNNFLTLTNTFLDCHKDPKLINGAFVGALSGELTYRHFAPLQDVHYCEWMKVEGYNLYEMHRVFDHYERTKFVIAQTGHNTREIIHQLCDGRGYEMSKYCIGI